MAPVGDELPRQLKVELEVSRVHLRQVVEHYWDRDWRQDHRDTDVQPDDHLWRAAAAVTGLQDALDRLRG